jgi:hypothetical protein
MDNDVEWVVARELELLTPEVRTSAERVDALLHPEFFEFGASGKRWDRDAMVAAIGTELTDGEVPRVSEVAGTRLSDTVIQVTYVTERPDRRARRSSLWRKDDGAWRVYFHQGTPLG